MINGKHTEETKQKISLAKIGNKSFLGKKHSEESKRKMSEARKRYYLNNPEAIKKIISQLVGRKQSKETIEKRVSKLRGIKRPQWVIDKIKHPKGKDIWNWKGGISQGNYSIRRSAKMKRWRISVFERDNYTCQYCKKIGGKLNAHHIKYFSLYPELRYDINNGITLCLGCHIDVHKKARVNSLA